MISVGDQQEQTAIANIPSIAERFEILRTLGRGAAGAVYLVRERSSGNEVALKVLKNPCAFDERTVDRFMQELAVCYSISHPNLVRAYDLVKGPGVLGFTMEYVNGGSLLELLNKRPLLDAEIDAIFVQVLGALHALHERGIVHRDIKPENILIAADGSAKLSDLGLVKRLDGEQLTKTGILLGTAAYLPPEYIMRSTFDARGDLYSLGIVLWEVLNRRRYMQAIPQGRIIEERLRTKFHVPALPANIQAKYRRIVGSATTSNPRQRYQEAREMQRAFQEVARAPTARSSDRAAPQVLDYGVGYDSRTRVRRVVLLLISLVAAYAALLWS